MFSLLTMLIGVILLTTTNSTIDLNQYFINVGTLAGAVVIVTEFLKGVSFIKNAPSWIKQVLSWTLAIAGSFIGNFFNFGVFTDLSTTYIIIYGLATGLIANGIFDFVLVQAFLDLFKKKQ